MGRVTSLSNNRQYCAHVLSYLVELNVKLDGLVQRIGVWLPLAQRFSLSQGDSQNCEGTVIGEGLRSHWPISVSPHTRSWSISFRLSSWWSGKCTRNWKSASQAGDVRFHATAVFLRCLCLTDSL